MAKHATGAPCLVFVAIASLYTLSIRVFSEKHFGSVSAIGNSSSLESSQHVYRVHLQFFHIVIV